MRLMRGYLKTAAMSAGDVGDTPLFVVDYAMRILSVLVLLALWRTILSGRESTGAMPLAAVLSYTVVAEVFAEQLAVRTTLSLAFWEGTLVIRFLRPMGMVRQLASEMAGKWLISLSLFSVPLLLVTPLLGVDPRPSSVVAGGLFILSLALAILVGLALDLFFGALTVALEQPVWLIEYTRTALATLLSGSLLPLAYYPWGLGDVFAWLPFAAMAWAPLAIFTGSGQPVSLFLRQLMWAGVLWAAANWLWYS